MFVRINPIRRGNASEKLTVWLPTPRVPSRCFNEVLASFQPVFVRINSSRRGKASEEDEDVVIYVDSTESQL